jgi:hypothetical protein
VQLGLTLNTEIYPFGVASSHHAFRKAAILEFELYSLTSPPPGLPAALQLAISPRNMADAARTSADGPFAHPPPAFDPNDPSSRDQHSGSPVQGSAVDNVTGSVDNAPNGQAATDQDGLSQSQNLPGLSAAHSADPDTLANVATVLSSEIGIATLLNRLKQSIASAREFALFLKKRAALEEDNCSGLKKLCRLTQDSMRRPEHRTGTFSQAYDEMVYIHERMAENGSHFAASLHQMHDDLVELASTAERSRKHWKTNGLSAEQKVADLEQAMRKQKTKYDALADEYERARTGEARQTGKVLNAFKNKSAAQQEEDLLRKVQAADASYQNHVQTVLQEKQVLESTTRPEAIQSLQDLIKELDSGLALQMQKFGMLSTLCFEPLSLALASYLSTLTVSSCFQRETPVEQWLEHQPYQGARRRRQPFSKESSSCRHVYRQRKRLDIVCLVAASQGPATSRGDQVRTQPSTQWPRPLVALARATSSNLAASQPAASGSRPPVCHQLSFHPRRSRPSIVRTSA